MNLLLAFIEDRRLGLGAMGAVAVIVGSALPWLLVPQPLIGSATGYGVQDEGKITVLLGALAVGLLIALARVRAPDLAIAAAVCGLTAAGVAAWYATRSEENAARVLARAFTSGPAPLNPDAIVPFPAQVGGGVFVVISGGVVLAVASVMLSLRGAGTSAPAPRSSS